MTREVLYFAYGERTPEVTEAIIGRLPEYEPAAATGLKLCVQSSVDIPEVVRNILGVNRTEDEMRQFQAYAAIESPGSHVRGLVYEVTQGELALLDNWDIEGLWFNRSRDRLVHIANEDDTSRLGRADFHAEPSGIISYDADPYEGIFPPALSDVGRTIEIARLARAEFLGER